MADEMKAARTLRAIVGSLALLAVIFHATALIVPEGQAVLVTRFGRPIHADVRPGLHWKLPWPIDAAVTLDMRRHVFEGGHTEMLTRDKRNVIVRTFAVWRIDNVLRFTQAIGSVQGANARLEGLLTNAAIATLGQHDLSAIVSTNARDLQVDQIESQLLADAAPLAHHSYGLRIEQIRLERIALPVENVDAVLAQMRAERRQYAARYQAEGAREASRIRSQAALQEARIRARGLAQSLRIRGESAAAVARIYANAHRIDPAFYAFVRSLKSIDRLITPDSTIILRTDSEPFRVLTGESARGGTAK